MNERTVRFYLLEMSTEGLTVSYRHRGHTISAKDLAELLLGHPVQRVGDLSAHIDEMSFEITFDPGRRTGIVVVNMSVVNSHDLSICLDNVCELSIKGYAMGMRLTLLEPGERIGACYSFLRVIPRKILPAEATPGWAPRREWKVKDPEELSELARKQRVFARTSPHQKLELVEAAQRIGHYLAVTGDGVVASGIDADVVGWVRVHQVDAVAIQEPVHAFRVTCVAAEQSGIELTAGWPSQHYPSGPTHGPWAG